MAIDAEPHGSGSERILHAFTRWMATTDGFERNPRSGIGSAARGLFTLMRLQAFSIGAERETERDDARDSFSSPTLGCKRSAGSGRDESALVFGK
jgi:hypothetical protein